MDKQVFGEIISDLAYAFGETWLLSEGALKTWYRYLSEVDERDLRKAVDHFAEFERRKPSLAELKSRCRREKADREHVERKDV